jgi:RNA polymerase sigma-70 factor (ECF subfamily)
MTSDELHPPRREAERETALHVADLELVRAALGGSLDARRRFAERLRCVPKILVVKNSHLGRPLSDPDLEDLVQETVLTIWKRLASYEGRASLETWAYRFCHFVLLRHLRGLDRRALEKMIEVKDPSGARAWSPARFEEVYHALSRVRPSESELLHLRHFEHLSFEEIGARLGLPPSTVKNHYRRAAARLRELLEPRAQEAS